MKPNRNQISPLMAIVAALALALTACGGGGGGDSQPGQPQPAPADPFVSVPPAVPAGQPVAYAPGSAKALALEAVNQAITRCGYPAMAPVVDLSAAAQRHTDYINLNNSLGHFEGQSLPGFTGVSLADRVVAAGGSAERANAAGEVAGSISTVKGSVSVVTGLLYAPYHQALLLSQSSEVGVGVAPENISLSDLLYGAWAVFDLGGERLNTVPANQVRTFPCDGSTGVFPRGGKEEPDPFPGLNGEFGPGLNFETNKDGVIVVDSISLKNETTGQVFPLKHIHDNGLEQQQYRAVFAAPAVLTQGTYRVDAKGTTSQDGKDPVEFERGYSFSVDY